MVAADLMDLKVEKWARDCFHGAATRSVDLGAATAAEKREAWVAMAMNGVGFCFSVVENERNEYLMRKCNKSLFFFFFWRRILDIGIR